MYTILKNITKILISVFILSFSKIYGQKCIIGTDTISVFPNPSNSLFTITYALPDTINIDKITLHLYDTNCKLAYQEDLYNYKNNDCKHVINSDPLASPYGFYILRLFYNNRNIGDMLIIIIK